MKNQSTWLPSKFVYKDGSLIASRDTREVSVSSRLVADIVASLYDAHIPQYASGRLVDLGCGKVPLYHVYQPHVVESICVDWGNTLHKNQHLDYECDLTQKLPFEDGEFNTIILSDVLEHIPKPFEFWREMSRVLSINGRVIMNVPFYYWLHETPHDYYRYTEYALKNFAELAGFRIVTLKPIGGVPEIMADIMAKVVASKPIIGAVLADGLQASVKAFICTKAGRKISEKTSAAFPLGYFMIAEKIKQEST